MVVCLNLEKAKHEAEVWGHANLMRRPGRPAVMMIYFTVAWTRYWRLWR